MRLFQAISLSLALFALAGLLPGCGQGGPSDQTAMEHAHDHEHADHGTDHPEAAHEADGEAVAIDGYRFRLEPDIAADGRTHLDFYIRDAEERHVGGAQVVLHLSGPDGETRTVELEAHAQGNHYGREVMLDAPGEYRAVVQVAIDGRRMNPRFRFARP